MTLPIANKIIAVQAYLNGPFSDSGKISLNSVSQIIFIKNNNITEAITILSLWIVKNIFNCHSFYQKNTLT